jgi:hypothetical protein
LNQLSPKIWKAALLATLAPPSSLLAVLAITQPLPAFKAALFTAALYFTVAWVVSLAAMFLFGLPYILLLLAKGRFNLLAMLVGSFAAGALTFWLIAVSTGSAVIAKELLSGGGFGLTAGLVLWAVARPNKSFKPNPLRGSA